MTLTVTDLLADVHAACETCGWLSSTDDADAAEADATEHATRNGHRVRVISKFVQVYEG